MNVISKVLLDAFTAECIKGMFHVSLLVLQSRYQGTIFIK